MASRRPDLGFTPVIVGECAGGDGESMTAFAIGWDRDLLGDLVSAAGLCGRLPTRSGSSAASSDNIVADDSDETDHLVEPWRMTLTGRDR